MRCSWVPAKNAPAIDRKSTRLNSSHLVISYAVSLVRKSTRLNSSHLVISYAVFYLKRIIEVLCLDHRDDGSKDLLLGDAGGGGHIDKHGRLHVLAAAVTGLSARHEAALGLADLDVLQDLLLRAFVDHRAAEIGVLGGALFEGPHPLHECLNHFLVHRRGRNQPRACRALLSLKAIAGGDGCGDGFLQVGFLIDDYRILAAHFGDAALQPV